MPASAAQQKEQPPSSLDSATFATAPVQPPAYTEAPQPNANLLPPAEPVPQSVSVVPGNLQLHYPPSGDGYVLGSSPQAMDDEHTARFPGLTVHFPMQPAAPQKLPPPQAPPR